MNAARKTGGSRARRRWSSLVESRPDTLEPGLRIHEGPLELGGGRHVDRHGSDALGRPVLLFEETAFEPEFFDRLLQTVASLRAAPARFSSSFARPDEPRVFVLAPEFPLPALQRLELLAEAFSLRGYVLPGGGAEHRPPQLVFPQVQATPESHLRDGPEPARRMGLRLLRAAAAIKPELTIQGAPWPLLLVGASGPCAALHRKPDALLLALQGEDRVELLELADDEAVDSAIDSLMRGQWGPATQPA